ncbi:hypothetical protein, partial [Pluralibacter gergoviae]
VYATILPHAQRAKMHIRVKKSKTMQRDNRNETQNESSCFLMFFISLMKIDTPKSTPNNFFRMVNAFS